MPQTISVSKPRGVGGLALMDALKRRTCRLLQAPIPPKAKACIFLTMLGGVSQMDTFDPKPALEKFDNTVMDWSKEKNTDQANLFAKPRLILKQPVSVPEVRSVRAWTFRACFPTSGHMRGRHGVRRSVRPRTAIIRPRCF